MTKLDKILWLVPLLGFLNLTYITFSGSKKNFVNCSGNLVLAGFIIQVVGIPVIGLILFLTLR